MTNFKETLPLNKAFLAMGRRAEDFELIREACIATLLADDEDVVEDLSTYLGSKPILAPDYHITKGFAGDDQVFIILESPSLRRRFVAYVGDLEQKYKHLIPHSFKTR